MTVPFGTDYTPLDTNSLVGYVRSRPELQAIFHGDEPLEVAEVGDGNLNLVFQVWAKADHGRSVVLKQAEDLMIAQGIVQKGDMIVVTWGSPMGQVGGTNALKIVKVGEF